MSIKIVQNHELGPLGSRLNKQHFNLVRKRNKGMDRAAPEPQIRLTGSARI